MAATGAQIIARSLRDLGVTVLFGIVGIPVVEIAEEAINLGIEFIGFRNEQAAGYAATAYGYLAGKPGVCLVVGGPGVLHVMAGVRTIFMSHRSPFADRNRLVIQASMPSPCSCSLVLRRPTSSIVEHSKNSTPSHS
jgi:hypothetical protein